MSTTTDGVRNGVDTAALFATLDAVKADEEIAKFRFRATNTWVTGTQWDEAEIGDLLLRMNSATVADVETLAALESGVVS